MITSKTSSYVNTEITGVTGEKTEADSLTYDELQLQLVNFTNELQIQLVRDLYCAVLEIFLKWVSDTVYVCM